LGRGASSNSIPEIERARFILVIGSNTTEAHPVLALRIKKAVRDGATLVVADPRKIWLTKIAKQHLQLLPGTDVWLLNAMMHTILSEGLQDDDYIREHTEDFDAVREVVSRYTPEDAEKVTGVPAEEIRTAARAYATERHAAIFYTLGITEHACGVDNIWSLSNLVTPARTRHTSPGTRRSTTPRSDAGSRRPGAPRCPKRPATGSTR
jgi:formate dehydrogenase major subunit/formate dehydrogenase alpha subunit